jgi:hypothetical protein
MQNKKLKPVQIPIESHAILKEYCELHDGAGMAKVLERLIKENCSTRIKLKTPAETAGVNKLSSK